MDVETHFLNADPIGLVVDEDVVLFSLHELLSVYDINDFLHSERRHVRRLYRDNVLLDIIDDHAMIEFSDFVMHVLAPYMYLKPLERFTESILKLFHKYNQAVCKTQTHLAYPSNVLIDHRPFQWTFGDLPIMLRHELTQRGILSKRFVGRHRHLGEHLYNACQLFMLFYILGDEVLSLAECQVFTKQVLDGYKVPYIVRDEMVLADLDAVVCVMTLVSLPRIEENKLLNESYIQGLLLEMKATDNVIMLTPQLYSLQHLIQIIEQIPYKVMAKQRMDTFVGHIANMDLQEYPQGSGQYFATWHTFATVLLPKLQFAPKNDCLIPKIRAPMQTMERKVLKGDIDTIAIKLLDCLKTHYPHKHGEPGLEEDSHVHNFLWDIQYEPYIKLKKADRKVWLEKKMRSLQRKGLIESVYSKKKNNFWYGWDLQKHTSP